MEARIERDEGTDVASGKWFVDQVQIGFTPGQGAMNWRCNKLVVFEPES